MRTLAAQVAAVHIFGKSPPKRAALAEFASSTGTKLRLLIWFARSIPASLGSMEAAMTSLDPCSPNYADAIAKARAEFLAASSAKEELQVQPEPAVVPYPLVSVGEVLKCPPLRWRVKVLIPARGIG